MTNYSSEFKGKILERSCNVCSEVKKEHAFTVSIAIPLLSIMRAVVGHVNIVQFTNVQLTVLTILLTTG